RPAHPSTLFPYTTLVRSFQRVPAHIGRRLPPILARWQRDVEHVNLVVARPDAAVGGDDMAAVDAPIAIVGEQGHRPRMQPDAVRSEEHTSELQSRENLVC